MSHPQQSQSSAQGGLTPVFVNVLCLDGGGVRGLSSLLILRKLIQRLSYQYSPPKFLCPCDIFDIICGTSTGGIIALMLGRLRMSVDEAIHAYRDFSRTVFKKTGAREHPMYDASKLEEWVKKVVSKRTGDKRTSLADPHGCRTFVVAVRQHYADSPAKLFRTYAANGTPADDCKIWEAARATTAAVPFFEPVTFGIPRCAYVDGEFSGSNNPSQLAIKEVANIFPSHNIGCLLSLGTGKPGDVISIPEDERGIADACEKLIKSCETVHNTTYDDFKRNRRGKGYIRLSVDRGLHKIQLDEWEREAELTGITAGYLGIPEVENRVKRCIAILMDTAGMTFENKIT